MTRYKHKVIYPGATMTENERILPGQKTRRMLFLIYAGFEILDVAGPASVFAAANMETETRAYVTEVISIDGGMIPSGAGPVFSSINAGDLILSDHDTLFVVGAEKNALDQALVNERLKKWLKGSVHKVGRFGSFCMGSFLLARADLLNHKNATTHWAACRWFADDYPEVSLDIEAVYVKDNRIWTSAGLTTGIDMAIAMVEEDLGRNVMGGVARRMIVYTHRSGRQAQISAALETQLSAGDAFSDTIYWLQNHLHEPIKVCDMAERAGMSERNFYRKFTALIEMTPSRYLEQLRLERARQYLEADMPIKAVSAAVGFQSDAGFRSAFKAHFGCSPAKYRQA